MHITIVMQLWNCSHLKCDETSQFFTRLGHYNIFSHPKKWDMQKFYYFFKRFCLFNWKIYRDTGRERKRETDLPPPGLPPKWLQWPIVGLLEVRNQELLLALPYECTGLSTWAILWRFPWNISRELDWKWVTGTQTGIQLGCQHCRQKLNTPSRSASPLKFLTFAKIQDVQIGLH